MKQLLVGFNLLCVVILVTDENSERTSSSVAALPTTEAITRNSSIKPIEIREFEDYKYKKTKEVSRKGKNILDWTSFFSGSETDPYLSRVNLACLSGDLSECFKSKCSYCRIMTFVFFALCFEHRQVALYRIRTVWIF